MLKGDFIKLRRRSLLGRKDSIRKNLDALKENTSKKTMAQKIYYEKHCQGRSPIWMDVVNKVPIHERLGNKVLPKRKVPLLGTSTNTLIPRSNRRYREGRRKRFSVQHRIDAIRQKQKEMLNNTQSMVQSFKIQVVNDKCSIQADSSQKFRLQLDSDVQAEIKQIQESYPRQIFHGLHPIVPASTHIPLNHRFTYMIE